MTELERLNLLTLDDVILQILPRLLDFNLVAEGDLPYMLIPEDEFTSYDRIIVNQIFTKPTLLELDAEFLIYKQELIDAENARLAEIARQDVVKAKLDGMDVRMVMHRLGKTDANEALFRTAVIEDVNEIVIAELEVEDIIYTAELAVTTINETKKTNGAAVRRICDSLLDLLAGNNIEKSLTIAQIDQMEIDYASIFNALKNFRPDKFKTLLVATTPDGVLVTQEDKDEYLAELAKYGI